jgi:ubiquinone/menaquinone biosynthesis C-methylase UbiE
MKQNLDKNTVDGFGEEWAKFDQSELNNDEYDQLFMNYFRSFPFEKLPKEAIGADIGCGSGRWAKQVANKVGKLYCVDASIEALNTAKKNLKEFDNIEFLNQSVDSIDIEDNSLDFLYSLGVLHHIPDTFDGIKSCAKKIKNNGYFLIYLYYNLDNRPFYFRLIWKISELGRNFISRLPAKLKFFLTDIIALIVYFPIAKLSKLLENIGFNVDKIPLSFYRNTSFYTMRTDALDRFGTRLEQRFSKIEIENMLIKAGFKDIVFNDKEPFWVAVGRKCVE